MVFLNLHVFVLCIFSNPKVNMKCNPPFETKQSTSHTWIRNNLRVFQKRLIRKPNYVEHCMFNLPWVKYTVHGSEMICASKWNFAHLSFTRIFLPQDVCDFKLHVYWPAAISVRHHCTFSGKSCKFASRFQHVRNSGDLVASLAPDVRCIKK